MMEERKAECFAAGMLLAGVDRYFIELPEMDFVSQIFLCVSAFQVPYKAVLVSLYEYAIQSENETLTKKIKAVFDLEFENNPETESLTIYSQDSDTYEFQRKAEAGLREIFTLRTPVPVSYKRNDAILCQLFRDGKISIENLEDYRKDIRKITYSKVQDDHSVILVTEVVDNDLFLELAQDISVHIIF